MIARRTGDHVSTLALSRSKAGRAGFCYETPVSRPTTLMFINTRTCFVDVAEFLHSVSPFPKEKVRWPSAKSVVRLQKSQGQLTMWRIDCILSRRPWREVLGTFVMICSSWTVSVTAIEAWRFTVLHGHHNLHTQIVFGGQQLDGSVATWSDLFQGWHWTSRLAVFDFRLLVAGASSSNKEISCRTLRPSIKVVCSHGQSQPIASIASDGMCDETLLPVARDGRNECYLGWMAQHLLPWFTSWLVLLRGPPPTHGFHKTTSSRDRPELQQIITKLSEYSQVAKFSRCN